MTKYLLAGWAALGLGLALGACVNVGSGGGKLPDRLFGLGNPTLSAATAVVGAPREALVLAEPETDRALALARMAATGRDGSVSYIKGGAWVDRPARLFRGVLAEALRGAGGQAGAAGRLVIFEETDTPAGAAHLSGRLLSFGYDEASHAAVVRFDALLRGADGRLAQRRFVASVPVAKPEAGELAAALSQASAQLAGELAPWVK